MDLAKAEIQIGFRATQEFEEENQIEWRDE